MHGFAFLAFEAEADVARQSFVWMSNKIRVGYFFGDRPNDPIAHPDETRGLLVHFSSGNFRRFAESDDRRDIFRG